MQLILYSCFGNFAGTVCPQSPTEHAHYQSKVWTHPLIENVWKSVSKLLTAAVLSVKHEFTR